MNEQLVGRQFDTRFTGDVSLEAVETYVRAAQQQCSVDRSACLAALDDIFASGEMPYLALDGRYAGQLLALDLPAGFTRPAQAITDRWLPWKGKRFDAADNSGINTFSRDSYLPARLLWPAYHGYRQKTAETYRAFRFQTSVGPARGNPDQEVLRLDYDLPENPRALIGVRRVLDELVQVADGYYVGKAYVHWYWGAWTCVAYFALRPVA